MSEKRFELWKKEQGWCEDFYCDVGYFIDNKTGNTGDFEPYPYVLPYVKLLNELYDENRELRQVNNDFEKLFSETISIADTSQLLENGNYDIKRMFVKELVDSLMSENEQLRQQLKWKKEEIKTLIEEASDDKNK